MAIAVKHSGTWKYPVVAVNDGGTWKYPMTWVNDGGTWKGSKKFLLTLGTDSSAQTGFVGTHYGAGNGAIITNSGSLAVASTTGTFGTMAPDEILPGTGLLLTVNQDTSIGFYVILFGVRALNYIRRVRVLFRDGTSIVSLESSDATRLTGTSPTGVVVTAWLWPSTTSMWLTGNAGSTFWIIVER